MDFVPVVGNLGIDREILDARSLFLDGEPVLNVVFFLFLNSNHICEIVKHVSECVEKQKLLRTADLLKKSSQDHNLFHLNYF